MTVKDMITEAITAKYLSSRPLPNAPDMEPEPAQADKGLVLDTLQEIQDQIKRGNPIPTNPEVILAAAQALNARFTDQGENDRLHLFEDVLDTLAKLDPNSQFVQKLNNVAITGLYQALPHPPASYAGRSQFRSADGGGNNIYWPELGQAGKPYARSVEDTTPIPAHELPEPGLVFDVLLKRRYDLSDGKNIHKGGQSALTFAFASLVTHSLFRTDSIDQNINNTSSYLDLSPLYGCSQEEQNAVRDKTGYGKLYPDCFSEERLLHLPPAVSALLIIFNRNHNYIADMLLKINEKGKWKDPNAMNDGDKNTQDEQIFQTARLVNCGHFMTMIFYDYVAGFLGQTRNGESWHLEPFKAMRRMDGTSVERGQGNNVSVEFNLLYRWHATISVPDAEWTLKAFEKELGVTEAQLDSMSAIEFAQRMGATMATANTVPPKERTFSNLVRGSDGKFQDTDIARILQNATATPAQRYGARGTPGALKPIEVLTMLSARRWGVCTMNEFRKFLGLAQFKSFEEWNSDPIIANAARSLYKHIDRLELYPGIQAEENLPMTSGSGFMCGYTLMRAILCDAICLVRGDRYYTTDYTTANLTTWGFQDVQPIMDNGAWGANLPKLLTRNLPLNYSYNSVYALFPFHTPDAMKVNLTKLKLIDQYDFNSPVANRAPKPIKTVRAIKTVWNDHINFNVTGTDYMKHMTQEYGFFLVFDDDKRHASDKALCVHALWPDMKTLDEYAEWYKTTTMKLIKQHSFKYDLPEGSGYNGRYCDIVANVINIVGTRWAADCIIGLSLKNEENPDGLFLEQEAYQILMVLFTYVFENVAPEHGWQLKVNAENFAKIINETIERSLKQFMPGLTNILGKVESMFAPSHSIAHKPCHGFLSRLAASGRDIKALTAQVMGLATGSSVSYAQACAQILDFYLDEDRAAERAEIIKLVKRTDPESTDLLVGYLKEGQRLAPQFSGLFRLCVSPKPIVIEQGSGLPDVTFQKGDIVWGSYADAHMDPEVFPDPLKINPRRPREKYIVQATGYHHCIGLQHVERTMVEMLRVIFSLKNLRRAPGTAGTLSSYKEDLFGTKTRLYLDNTGKLSAWPGRMTVVWDD